VAQGTVALARRDRPGKEGKSFVPRAGIAVRVRETLVEVQQSLYERALKFREDHTYKPADYGEFKEAIECGFALTWWCGDPGCETSIKEETRATNRCIPLEQPGGSGRCIFCGRDARQKAIFARAY